MRFSRIVLENWRNFGRVDVRLQNRVFLVGPNASGKSNFLDALRFLRDLVTSGGGFQKAVEDRRGVTRLRNLAARRKPDIAVEVVLTGGKVDEWRYRIAFSQDNRRIPLIKEEKVWRGDRLILDRPDSDDGVDRERLRQTHLEQTLANREFREIADFFASVHYSHISPPLVRDPRRAPGRRASPYGEDFLEQIARTNRRTREFRLRRIRSALRIAVPQLKELKLEHDESGVPHLSSNYEHWRPHGAWQNEKEFSDGTLRLVGLLWSFLDGNGPILLEEPEHSLHPEVVRYIPQIMLRALRRRRHPARQSLVSTHSSDLLHDPGIAADEILLFIPSREGSDVKQGAEIEEVRLLLESGVPVSEVALPHTNPPNLIQVTLLKDWG